MLLGEKKGISNKIEPSEILKKFDICLQDDSIEDSKLFEILKDLILNVPKTSGKFFFNQLFGGLNSKAVLGDLLAVLLNHTMSTYKIAGPMVEIEREIIRKI